MARVRWDGDASNVLREQEKMVKGAEKYAQSLRDGAKSASSLEKAAVRIKEAIDPQERFNRKVRELNELQKAGKLSIEQVAAATQKYREQLDHVTGAGKRAFELKDIGAFVGQLRLAESVASGLQRAFAEIRAERERAAQQSNQRIADFGELAQISPSKKKFNELKNFAEQFIAAGIVEPGNQGLAATIAFQLDSAGLSNQDKQFLLAAAKARFVKPEAVAGFGGAIGSLQAALGIAETGGAREIASKAVAAAAPTRANAQAITDAASRVGAVGRPLGLTEEEIFAAVSRVTEVFGTASEAETRVRAFVGAIDKTGFDRGTLLESITAINKAVAGGKTPRQLLGGSDEALAAFNILADEGAFSRRLADVTAAGTGDEILKRFKFVESDPLLRSGLRRAEAEGRLALTTQNVQGEAENLVQSLFADLAERRRRESPGFITEVQTLLDKTLTSLPFGLGDPTRLLRAASNTPDLTASDPSLARDIRDYLRRVDENTAGMRRDVRSKSTTRPE